MSTRSSQRLKKTPSQSNLLQKDSKHWTSIKKEKENEIIISDSDAEGMDVDNVDSEEEELVVLQPSRKRNAGSISNKRKRITRSNGGKNESEDEDSQVVTPSRRKKFTTSTSSSCLTPTVLSPRTPRSTRNSRTAEYDAKSPISTSSTSSNSSPSVFSPTAISPLSPPTTRLTRSKSASLTSTPTTARYIKEEIKEKTPTRLMRSKSVNSVQSLKGLNNIPRSKSDSKLRTPAKKSKRSRQKEEEEFEEESSSSDDDSDFDIELHDKGKEPEDEDEDEDDVLSAEEEDEEIEVKKEEISVSRKEKKVRPQKKKPLPNIYNPEHDEGDISPYKWEPEEAPQPKEIRIKMLGYQKESLKWMVQQENSPRFRGGILADDMGMGKTLQAIALVVATKQDSTAVIHTQDTQDTQDTQEIDYDDVIDTKSLFNSSTSSTSLSLSNSSLLLSQSSDMLSTSSSTINLSASNITASCPTTTLVICPVVAIAQWASEIIKYTVEGTLKVKLLHGVRDDCTADTLAKYDVVLTTYSIVESDFRKQTTGLRRKDKETGKYIYVKKQSLLHSIHWHRIILDEAHCIKDRSCSTARAVFNLSADKRWSLTGTPLQNRIGELYSLIRFLQITPYSYYYCKKCDCKSLFWKFEGRSPGAGCQCCGHSAMSHFSWWNKHVLNPITKHGMTEVGEHSMEILKSILQRTMLRRTKIEKAADLRLPPRVITVRYDELDDEENDFYDALYTQSQTKFMGFVKAGTVLNNYANVFDLLLRLRQALDHPYLVLHRHDNLSLSNSDNKDNKTNDICQLCYDPAEDPVISKCKHTFCRVCIETYMQSKIDEKTTCPVCYRALSIDLTQPVTEVEEARKTTSTAFHLIGLTISSQAKSILQRIDLSAWRSSTKIEALMEELTKMRNNDPNAKALVFSQFVNFLDLVDWRLKMAGIGCVKLDGRMSQIQKAAAIEKFNNDPDVFVFLISLKAGGVALNLTVANYCFMMDPWWNPAAEFQAIDRIHRLGQYKCVQVIRFVIPNTIEERIIKLQDKKHLLFQSTVGMDADALAKLSVEDLRFLFGK